MLLLVAPLLSRRQMAEMCQDRVQYRVGHPKLGAGPGSAAVVSRMARGLRPPHRKEGFHNVLRCKGERDLHEAVALLSMTAMPAVTNGGPRTTGGTLGVAASPTLKTNAVDAFRDRGSAWNRPLAAGAPTVDSATLLGQTGNSGGEIMVECPAPVPLALYPSEVSCEGKSAGVDKPGMTRGQGFSSGGRLSVPLGRTRDAASGPADAEQFPALESVSSSRKNSGRARETPDLPKTRLLTPADFLGHLGPQATPPSVTYRGGDSWPSTEWGQREADPVQPPLAPANLMPWTACRSLSAEVNAGQNSGVSRVGGDISEAASGNGESQAGSADMLPAAPVRRDGRSAAGVGAGATASYGETTVSGRGDGVASALRASGSPDGLDDGLDLSEGEAFFVLQDMFGGLLPSGTLDSVFAESAQDLEEVGAAAFVFLSILSTPRAPPDVGKKHGARLLAITGVFCVLRAMPLSSQYIRLQSRHRHTLCFVLLRASDETWRGRVHVRPERDHVSKGELLYLALTRASAAVN